MKIQLRRLLLGAAFLGTVATSSQAADLLQIDITDPTSVRFYTTTNAASWDVFLMQSVDGFTLMDFFMSTPSRSIISASSSTLTAPAYPMTGSYNFAVPGDYTASYSAGPHLTIFQDPWSYQKFSDSSPAFSGTMSLNLSPFASFLPPRGVTGEIRPGSGFVQGASFGQYQIIARTVTTAGDVTPTPGPNPHVGDWNVGGAITIGGIVIGSLRLDNRVSMTNTQAFLGRWAGSDGMVTVNSSSHWESTGDLYVGYDGAGQVVVGDQATVASTDTSIAEQAGSTGTVEITGNGATWENSGDFFVGRGGTASLTVGNGATLKTQTLSTAMDSLHSGGNGTIQAKGVVLDFSGPGEKLVFDSTHGTSQTLAFGTGGTLSLDINGTGALGVGFRDAGEMQIKDGVKVTSTQGSLGMLTGSSGTATVSGTGSEWNSSVDLFVGQDGIGDLTIANGGRVSNVNGSLGANAGSIGTVLVTGTGSTWENTGTLHVGQGGAGSLTVADGGAVTVTGALTVHGADDSLILEGGTVTADGGVFLLADATLGGTGTIDGNLSLASGANFAFGLNTTLAVTGTVSLDTSFGIASLLGLDATTAEGAYTLMTSTLTDFSTLGLQNWGYENRFRLSAEGAPYKAAYFSQGSLVVNVVPEPGTGVLLLVGLGTAYFVGARRRREDGRQ